MDKSESGWIYITEKTNRSGNIIGGSTKCDFFSWYQSMGNGVNGSLFSGDLAIYITARSQIMAARALQGVSNED